MIEQHSGILSRLYELRKYIRESYPEYPLKEQNESKPLDWLIGEEYYINSIIELVDFAIEDAHTMVQQSFDRAA